MTIRLCTLILAASVLGNAETFSADVYPIVRARCQNCHQEGEIAPMAFTDYNDTRPWAKAIREAVMTGTMPPWHADGRSTLAFHNDRSLTQAEIRKIVAWVDGGAKEGRKIEYPKPVKQESAWKLGKPDVILRIPGFKVQARGDIPYTFVINSIGLTEDRWIRAAEFRIDKRSVVHHMNAFVRPPGSSYLEGLERGKFLVPTLTQRRVGRPGEGVFERRELLLGYEPGYAPIPWRDDQAKLIRAGSDIVFEIHYTANGKEQTDYFRVRAVLRRKAPARTGVVYANAGHELRHPAGRCELQVRGVDHIRPASQTDFSSAAHASSRKGHGDPCALSGWPGGDFVECASLQLQLADHVFPQGSQSSACRLHDRIDGSVR